MDIYAVDDIYWNIQRILGGFVGGIFIPNMLKKDKSLSRYPEFADYKERSGLLFPKLFLPTNIKVEEKNSTN